MTSDCITISAEICNEISITAEIDDNIEIYTNYMDEVLYALETPNLTIITPNVPPFYPNLEVQYQIDNYNPDYEYDLNVSDGTISIDLETGIITWIMPNYETLGSFMTIVATNPISGESSDIGTNPVEVSECQSLKPDAPIFSVITPNVPPYLGGETIEVAITNYLTSNATYYTNTTGGYHSLNIETGIISWTLPEYGGVAGNDYTLSAQVEETICGKNSDITRGKVTVEYSEFSSENVIYYENLDGSSGRVASSHSQFPSLPNKENIKLARIEKIREDTISLRQRFVNCENMTTFESDVTLRLIENFTLTWSGCSSLLEFPAIDLSSAIEMNSCWSGCSSLLEFPAIDFSNVVRADGLWSQCSSLIELRGFDFSSVIVNNSFFRGCGSLKVISDIDFSNLEDAESLCDSLENLEEFSNVDLSSATSLNSAWNRCSSLVSFSVINFPIVTSAEYTWAYCSNLSSFPSVNMPLVENLYNSWGFCYSLTSFPSINLLSATDLNASWHQCTSLEEFNASVSCDATTQYTWSGTLLDPKPCGW